MSLRLLASAAASAPPSHCSPASQRRLLPRRAPTPSTKPPRSAPALTGSRSRRGRRPTATVAAVDVGFLRQLLADAEHQATSLHALLADAALRGKRRHRGGRRPRRRSVCSPGGGHWHTIRSYLMLLQDQEPTQWEEAPLPDAAAGHRRPAQDEGAPAAAHRVPSTPP